jgi:carbonic anhydrase
VGIPLNDLLNGNYQYVEGFTQGDLALPPARKLAAVVCMDARIDPLPLLGLHLGDIHVIRNAGGRVTEDALRSLAISERLLGTDTVLVIHHTGCGMLTFNNEQIRDQIKRELGDAAYEVAEQTDFLPFPDLEQSVREDVTAIKASPLIPDSIPVYGFIYDVHTGGLARVQ